MPQMQTQERHVPSQDFYRQFYPIGTVVAAAGGVCIVIGFLLALFTGHQHGTVAIMLMVSGFFAGLLGLIFSPFSEDS